MQNAKCKINKFFPEVKIGGGLGNFVRYAVAESAAYLGVCEHLRRK